jgi:hypothetical protein
VADNKRVPLPSIFTFMKWSICILHHPARRGYIPYLLYKLGNVRIFTDIGQGLIKNCQDAWKSYNKEALWHIVIEDDTLICHDFYDELDKALINKDTVYNLFYQNDKVFGGLGICIPTKYIDGLIDYSENGFNKKVFYYPWDVIVRDYCDKNGIKREFVIPSLLDHRDTGSLVNKKWDKKPRRAKFFIGE